ncbi:ROK family protein [Streptomyces kunmingensis]|uniref:ROK family protein n=1 Tax=Streptomyces kunmingensis TaxID=68225 RepID=A0ABU6CKE7_9ACTN|nr:ROK family protein [Streptomyces kunmingensis]MEB3965188.1 ROK family protein [Streptomyces kunmingensis]
MTTGHPPGDRTPVPVLDIGGTHVTAALVDPVAGRPLPSSVIRRRLESDAEAPHILDTVARAALELPAGHRPHWGVAVPGPFDYATGIGRFTGVGKFDSLDGVDVGAGLRQRMADRAERLCFLNDATAFALGEYRAGAAAGHDRAVCLTLGTGVGSAFLSAGRPVDDGPDIPPSGHVHRLTLRGRPLEDTVSRQAIRAHYARLASLTQDHERPDVDRIAALATEGDAAAREAFRYAFDALGRALAPWIDRFEATAVVIGGSMAQSWNLIHPALGTGLTLTDRTHVSLLPARQPAEAPLIGAAHWAQHTPGAPRGPAHRRRPAQEGRGA